jgi:hypothetical protein
VAWRRAGRAERGPKRGSDSIAVGRTRVIAQRRRVADGRARDRRADHRANGGASDGRAFGAASHRDARAVGDAVMSAWRALLIATWAIAAAVMLACDDSSAGGDAGASPTAAAASAAPTPTVPPGFDSDTILDEFPKGGSPKNQVRLVNEHDGRFMARASIVLRRLEDGDGSVNAVNMAVAEGRCTDCQTIAVALQVVLYQRGAEDVQPQNIALALNANCTRCVTVARAIQYVIPVDDPKAVPDEVVRLVKDMDKELRYFSTVHTLSELDPDEAVARLNKVMAQYADLQGYLTQAMDQKRTGDDPKASSSASPASSPSSSPSSPAPSASQSPTPTPAASP